MLITYSVRISRESIPHRRMADPAIVSDPFAGAFHGEKRWGKLKLKRCWEKGGAAESYVNHEGKGIKGLEAHPPKGNA